MTLQQPFSSYERKFIFLLVVVGIATLFFQLGINPLIQEEPRRALIALEMDLQNNVFVPTQTGDNYYRKPPFFNWMIMLSSKVFGGYTEWAIRSLTVFSHILLSLIVFQFFKSRTQFEIAVLTSLSFFFSVDIYYYFTNLGEIDLFYALLTASSIMLVFYFDEKKKNWSLFISIYFVTAICFLTKGLSALPYTALTLLAYFITKKKTRMLFSLQHFVGIGLLITILAAYFYVYSTSADVFGWWTTLLSESAGRAGDAGITKRMLHILEYPFQTLKNVLPAALLLPAIFLKGEKRYVDKAWLWIILLNFAVYWFSAEGRARYIYPLFPFICYLLIERTAAFDKKWLYLFLRSIAITALGIATLAAPIAPFVDELSYLPNRWLFVLVVALLLVMLWFSLFKLKVRPLMIIMGALILGKIGFSYILPQSRMQNSNAAKDKALAYEIMEITKDAPISRWGDVRISLTTAFYLERDREQILYQNKEIVPDIYYLVYEKELANLPNAELVLEFDFRGNMICLVKTMPST